MVMKEVDDQLTVFLEMQRREQEIERGRIHLLPGSDKVDAVSGFNPLSSPMLKTLSMDRKMGADEFLNLGNEKNDLLWLLSPPGTPILTSLRTEVHDRSTSQILNSSVHPTALTSSAENVQLNPLFKKPTEPEHSSLPCEPKSSSNINKKSSSLGSCKSTNRRAATPTGRPMVPAANKPSRSSTPSRVSTRSSSTRPVGLSATRSSTPTRFTARSSTPTPRSSSPVPKSTLKQSVPNIQPSTQSNTSSEGAPKGQARSSSAPKSRVITSRTAVPRNVTLPTLDPPRKPSAESSPSTGNKNPKSCVTRRPISASRVRPSASTVKSFPPIKSHRSSNESDEVNPVMMGTKMVERIVNMRKLAPPKQDAQLGAQENLSAKYSSSLESSGFGRSLSKKSLDMAMRHMDITGSTAGTISRARSGRTKSKNAGASCSPLNISSNGSSDVTSVNSNSTSIDGSETEDNVLGAVKVSPAMVQGR